MSYRDLTGKRFGMLVARQFVPRTSNNRAGWLCDCDCGNQKVILTGNLNKGHARSCGCNGFGRKRDHDLHDAIRGQLDNCDGLTVKEIADAVGYIQQTVRSALYVMEEEGDVTRIAERIGSVTVNIWSRVNKLEMARFNDAEHKFLYGAVL